LIFPQYNSTDGPINDFEKNPSKVGQRRFIDAEKELFMWSVCLNRVELCTLFWQAGNDQIALALGGASILLSFSKIANTLDMIEQAEDLEAHAR
jgi:hypothetical protein